MRAAQRNNIRGCSFYFPENFMTFLFTLTLYYDKLLNRFTGKTYNKISEG